MIQAVQAVRKFRKLVGGRSRRTIFIGKDSEEVASGLVDDGGLIFIGGSGIGIEGCDEDDAVHAVDPGRSDSVAVIGDSRGIDAIEDDEPVFEVGRTHQLGQKGGRLAEGTAHVLRRTVGSRRFEAEISIPVKNP